MNKDKIQIMYNMLEIILTDNHKFKMFSKRSIKYIADNNLWVKALIYDYLHCTIYNMLDIIPFKHIDVGDNTYIKIEYIKNAKCTIGYIYDKWVDVLNEKIITDETTINLLNMMI